MNTKMRSRLKGAASYVPARTAQFRSRSRLRGDHVSISPKPVSGAASVLPTLAQSMGVMAMVTRAQFEGAAVFGASLARFGEITATNGVVDQANFDSYPVSRMNEAPYQTNVYIVESSAPPAGVGEPGVPPFTPALCNAIFAATGKRVRELPLSRNKLGA